MMTYYSFQTITYEKCEARTAKVEYPKSVS